MALTRPTAAQINTVVTTITDPLVVLNRGATAANIDVGFILNRGSAANVAMVWQESSGQFVVATTSSSGLTNANITVSSYANLRTGNLITTSVTYANGQSILTNVESAITTANTNLKGYVDGQISTTTTAITTANTNLKGYTDNLVTTANTNLKGYTDGQISTTTTAITTANTNLKGYVDSANTIQSGQITTVSSSVTGANAAIVTANTNLKGYVDGQISTTTTAITTANTNLKGYTDNLVTTANTNMKGYVDSIDSTKANLSGATFTGAVTTTELSVTSPGGDEGGQINLAKAVTNTTLVTGVVIDVYQNKLRIWEGGGTNRGGYFDIAGLGAGVGTNLAAGGGGSPGGADTQVQFNNSSSFGGALSLHYFSGNGVVLANAAVASTSTTTGALQVSGGIGVAGNVWCGQVYSTNNGNGTNYRIGDDAWLGDVNTADTTQLMGAQNGNNGYLRFGNVGTETLGRAGSGALTWTGTFTAGNINSDNHNYANGTSIITTLSNTITTANTNMKGYVDNSVSSLSSNKISASGSNVTVTASFVNVAINSTNVASVSSAGLSITGNITAGNITAGGVRQTISTSAPTGAMTGDQWYDTATDTLFQYVYDGTGYVWVDISGQPLNVNIGTVQGTSLSISGSGSLTGALTLNSSNGVTALINGGTNGTGNIGASGASFNTIFAKASSAQYADLAEKYIADVDYAPGTVLIFGGTYEVTISSISHDTRVAGVITTNPAFIMNETLENSVTVALTGRVPCQVLGPINKGDRLVSSQHPGVAQCLIPALYEPGCIIGKSLETIDTNEIKLIEIAIGRF